MWLDEDQATRSDNTVSGMTFLLIIRSEALVPIHSFCCDGRCDRSPSYEVAEPKYEATRVNPSVNICVFTLPNTTVKTYMTIREDRCETSGNCDFFVTLL
jgi:hypothetical protein